MYLLNLMTVFPKTMPKQQFPQIKKALDRLKIRIVRTLLKAEIFIIVN